MKMKKSLLTLAAFSMSMSMLAGCGGGNGGQEAAQGSTNSKTAAPGGGSNSGGQLKGEITYWHSFTQPDRQKVMEELVKEFEKENPAVKVNVEVYPWAAFHTKWTTGLATKALPDISSALIDEAIAMAQADALSPMDDVLQSMGKEKFLEKPLEMLSYNGKVIALPYYTHARALLYRKDLLQEKGINPPQTWDELLAAAQAVNNPPNVNGFAVPLSKKDYYGTLHLYFISKSMGSHLLTKDGKANLTDPNMIKSINYLAELYKKASPQGSVNYATKEYEDAFAQGKTAFMFGNGFNINGILSSSPQLADKIGVLPPPKVSKDSKETGWMADYISIVRWKQSKYPEITKKFVEFLYSKERYTKFLHVVPGGMLPGLKDVAGSKEFLDHPVIQKYKAEIEIIQQGVVEGTPIASEFGSNPYTNVIKNQGIIEEMLQKVVSENVPVEKAAREAEDNLNKSIKEMK